MQGRLYRSLRLWSFYCDLEESLGTLESTRAVYDRILELRIATPQLILNYALFLQVAARSFAWNCRGGVPEQAPPNSVWQADGIVLWHLGHMVAF